MPTQIRRTYLAVTDIGRSLLCRTCRVIVGAHHWSLERVPHFQIFRRTLPHR